MIREEDLHGTFEDRKRLVGQFNLLDDIFFSVVMEDKAACEYLLSRLLERPVRYIKSNKTQYSIRNLEQHSIVLDALIEDDKGTLYNIEVQVNDKENDERRIRFYSASVDSATLEKNTDYAKLPDLYMIFISAYDPFKRGKLRYEVKKYVDGDFPYNDGEHIIYFNTAVDDGSSLSELMQYFKDSAAGSESFGALSEAVNYFKSDEKGVFNMSETLQNFAEMCEARGKAEGMAIGETKKAVETADRMLDSGMPIETALYYAGIDNNTYLEYKKNNALYM